MDAVEFLKERERMCREYTSCSECPFGEIEQGFTSTECAFKYNLWPAESLVIALQAWITSHPKTTNAMKFKEVFGVDLYAPDTPTYDNQVLTYNGVVISDWLKQPYKEPKKGAIVGRGQTRAPDAETRRQRLCKAAMRAVRPSH